jgi:hypothetical protein
MQCSISILIAGLLHPLLFEIDPQVPFYMGAAGILTLICAYWLQKKSKIEVEF